jgi:hypothetical protein
MVEKARPKPNHSPQRAQAEPRFTPKRTARAESHQSHVGIDLPIPLAGCRCDLLFKTRDCDNDCWSLGFRTPISDGLHSRLQKSRHCSARVHGHWHPSQPHFLLLHSEFRYVTPIYQSKDQNTPKPSTKPRRFRAIGCNRCQFLSPKGSSLASQR